MIVSVHFTFPFIEPKALLFRALVDVAFAAWTAGVIVGQIPVPRFTPVLWAMAAVLALLIVVDCMSPIPFLAFFSRRERSEGFVELAHLGALIALGSFLLDTERLRRQFLTAQVIGGLLVGLIALLAFYTYAIDGAPSQQIFSTLGNSSYLGQYAALLACIAAFLLVGATRRTRWFFGFLLLLDVVTIYLSQSRGGALGLVVASFVAVGVAASPRDRWRGLVAAAVILGVLVLAPMLITDIPRVRRFTEIDLDDPRFFIWGIGWRAFVQRPLLGWGQDGFLLAGGFEQAIDRAHNLLLDWLVVGGVVGAALWGCFLGTIHSAARLVEGRGRVALYAFLVAYCVTNMFLFDTLTSYLLLGAVAATVSARWAQVFNTESPRALAFAT